MALGFTASIDISVKIVVALRHKVSRVQIQEDKKASCLRWNISDAQQLVLKQKDKHDIPRSLLRVLDLTKR